MSGLDEEREVRRLMGMLVRMKRKYLLTIRGGLPCRGLEGGRLLERRYDSVIVKIIEVCTEFGWHRRRSVDGLDGSLKQLGISKRLDIKQVL